MTKGGSGGWFVFGDNDAGAGEADGDEVVDMTSVIVPDLSPAAASLLLKAEIRVSECLVQANPHPAASHSVF